MSGSQSEVDAQAGNAVNPIVPGVIGSAGLLQDSSATSSQHQNDEQSTHPHTHDQTISTLNAQQNTDTSVNDKSDEVEKGKSQFLQYNKLLRESWTDMPDIEITWRNLSYVVAVPVDDTSVPGLGKALLRPITIIKRLINKNQHDDGDHNKQPHQLKSHSSTDIPSMQRQSTLGSSSVRTRQLGALYHCDGKLRPGQMTLILAPPGHGKSVLLKCLSQRIINPEYMQGDILYNSLTAKQAQQRGWYLTKLLAYVYQSDNHLATLTVKETIQFALDNAVATTKSLGNPELDELHKRKADLIIRMLNLVTAADTIAGNALLRGVSGGEKKRLSIGEQLVLNARCIFLDEPTTGLDASVAYDITSTLREWVQLTKSSVLAAYLQPTPETYRQFDTLILMRHGQIIYQGPRNDVVPYILSLGAHKPDYQDEADFLTDFLTTPEKYRNAIDGGCCDGNCDANIGSSRNSRSNSDQRNNHHNTTLEASTDVSRNGVSHDITNDTNHHNGLNHVHSPGISDSDELAHDLTTKPNKLNQRDYKYSVWTTQGLVERYKSSEMYSELMNDTRSPDGKHYAINQPHFERQKSEQPDENNYPLYGEPTELVQIPKKAPKHGDDVVSALTRQQFCQQYVNSWGFHFASTVNRQRKIVTRNKSLWIPRWATNVVMALILGGLFYNTATSNYQTRVGLILFAIVTNAFANMSELPATDEAKPVIYKQVDSGFFPPICYNLAVTLNGLPVAMVSTFILSSAIYWMTNFAPDVGRFFFFCLVVYCTDLLCGAAFRFISYSVRNMFVAQQIDGPCVGLFMVFGGFLITYGAMPRWLIWMYWLSPFAWAVRSIAIMEFSAPRYTHQEEIQYLSGWDIQTDFAYTWAGIGYLLGLFVFFTMLGAIQIKYKRNEVTVGTKRRLDLEDEESGRLNSRNSANNIEQKISIGDTDNASNDLPFHPVTVVWRNLSYTVTLKNKKQKRLLTNISGYCEPGEMTALMGSSGAGKTTLMDVICGRKTEGVMDGEILVNGQPKVESAFRKLVGYCEQTDLHMPYYTVHESLMFSARLRLPREVTAEQRESFVAQIEELLELTAIKDRIIGNPTVGGLAPGQLKLVTMGVELAANPSVLCLDEPTSGLDSRAAVIVMEGIQRIAKTGRTVLCTIHQPSADVFFFFDRLLLLKTGGFTVYNGTVGKQGKDLVRYFESATENPPKLPKNMNPASWMLDVVSANNLALSDATHADKQVYDYKDVYAESESSKQIEQHIEQILHDDKQNSPVTFKNRYAQNILVQFQQVFKRQWLSYYRNVPFNGTRIMVQVVLGIIYGLIFMNQFSDVTSQNPVSLLSLSAVLGGVFVSMAFGGIVNSSTALPVIAADRPIFYREKASNTYNPVAYSLSMFLVEIPYIMLGALFYTLPFYYLLNLKHIGSVYIGYLFLQMLLAFTFNGIGHMLAAALPNILAATQVQGLFFTFSFLFGGVFVHGAQLSPGWKWIYNINPVPKAIFSALDAQFIFSTQSVEAPPSALSSDIQYSRPANNQFTCPSGNTIDATSGVCAVNVATYISQYTFDIAQNTYWIQVGWIILIAFVLRIGAMLALQFISHAKR